MPPPRATIRTIKRTSRARIGIRLFPAGARSDLRISHFPALSFGVLRHSGLNPAVRVPKIEPASLLFNDRAVTSHDCAPPPGLAQRTPPENPRRSRRSVRGKPL